MRRGGAEYGFEAQKTGGVLIGVAAAGSACRHQPVRHRVGEGCAIARGTHHQAHPGSNGAGKMADRPSGRQIVLNGSQQPYGEFLRTVPRDLREQVADVRIGEAVQHGAGISIEIKAIGRGEPRQDFLVDQPVDPRSQCDIGHRIGDAGPARSQSSPCERGVGAVQHPELDEGVARNIAGEERAGIAERRDSSGISLFDNPEVKTSRLTAAPSRTPSSASVQSRNA